MKIARIVKCLLYLHSKVCINKNDQELCMHVCVREFGLCLRPLSPIGFEVDHISAEKEPLKA